MVGRESEGGSRAVVERERGGIVGREGRELIVGVGEGSSPLLRLERRRVF